MSQPIEIPLAIVLQKRSYNHGGASTFLFSPAFFSPLDGRGIGWAIKDFKAAHAGYDSRGEEANSN